MKRSAIRICCATVLMGIALVISVAAIGAVSDRAEEAFVWTRLRFAADAEEIRLFSADGQPTQVLRTDAAGTAVSGLMTPGKYYAVTCSGCTEFVLHEDATVSAEGGCGWTDGETLHLNAAEVGAVSVERLASEELLEQGGGWLDYTLSNAETERREVLRCRAAGELLRCTFQGVPYGTYVLKENGVTRCTVTVGADRPELTVSLP